MKVVAVNGSPHGMKGNTGMLLQAAVDSAEKLGAGVTVFSLAESGVKPCCDCAVCHKTGKCPIKDDFDTIKGAMIDSDGIVLASPNYIWSVSAQMKALMDRCCGLLHTQMLDGRYAAAVVTSGGAESAIVESYMLRFLSNLGCRAVGSVGAQARELFDPRAKVERLAAAADLGEELVDAIRLRKQYPAQESERRGFAERMKTLVTTRKDEWPYEYEHWKAKKEP